MSALLKRSAFTLMELLIVIVIAGIIAAMAVPNFMRMKEQAVAREAISGLRLIAAAEKTYNSESGSFYPPLGTVGINQINTDLHLSLNNRNWDYSVDNSAAPAMFTAHAVRNDGQYSGCEFLLSDNTANGEPVLSAASPANCAEIQY